MERNFSPARRQVLAVSTVALGGLVLAGRVFASGAGYESHEAAEQALSGASEGREGSGSSPSQVPNAVMPNELSAHDLIGKKLRVAKEDDMLTMDYSPDRVTVLLDADGKITSVRIG